MSDLISILEQYRELLSDRGYEALGLGTMEEPGFFMQELERSFSLQMQKAALKKAPWHFDVKGVGFFNEEKDMVCFHFSYQYDRHKKRVDLVGLKAEMENAVMQYRFDAGMHELPQVDKIIGHLAKKPPQLEMPAPPVLRPDPNSTRDLTGYQSILAQHQALLLSKGYTDKQPFPFRDYFLEKKLEAKLCKAYWNESGEEAQTFRIRTHGYFGAHEQEVRFSLFYYMDQEHKSLHLTSLMVDCSDKRIIYPLHQEGDLPAADQVWQNLKGELKIENAQVVYPKQKIKELLHEQDHFLNAIGYHKTFFSAKSDFLDTELQQQLEKKLLEIGIQEISIGRQIHLSLYDQMPCLFQYAFDPVQVNLKLDHITVKVGEIQAAYEPQSVTTMGVTLQTIYEDLSMQNQMKKAQRIVSAGETYGVQNQKRI